MAIRVIGQMNCGFTDFTDFTGFIAAVVNENRRGACQHIVRMQVADGEVVDGSVFNP